MDKYTVQERLRMERDGARHDYREVCKEKEYLASRISDLEAELAKEKKRVWVLDNEIRDIRKTLTVADYDVLYLREALAKEKKRADEAEALRISQRNAQAKCIFDLRKLEAELEEQVARLKEVLLLAKDYVSTAISMSKIRGGSHKVADWVMIEIKGVLSQ